MQTGAEDRIQRKRRLLEFYGLKTGLEDETRKISSDPRNIDSAEFDRKLYLDDLFRKCDLNDLVAKETEVCEQIRSLDSEMQTLVYDNYKKFINAIHTIRMMKSNFKLFEDEMNSLTESMAGIRLYSGEIDKEISETRSSIKKLASTADNLQKLGYLSSLPSKLRELMTKEEWSKAVEAYGKAKGFFEKHRNIPTFQGIDRDCTDLINEIEKEVEARLYAAEDAQALTASTEVLIQLGQPISELSEKFLHVAFQRIDLMFQTIASQETAQIEEAVLESSADQGLLNFANAAADTLSECVLPYVFAYSSLFLSNAGVPLRDAHLEEDLKVSLFNCLQNVTQNYLTLVDKRIQDGVQSVETSLLVRALDRLYSRLAGFGRSILEVVAPSESSPVANEFKQFLDKCSLNMVLGVAAQCCREKQFFSLKAQAVDCLTDVRQQLVTNTYPKPTNSESEGAKQTLTEIYNEMSRVLATNLRDCLKSLEPFLSSDNTFSHLQPFRAAFCLDYVREGIITAYLRFLIQFSEDLFKCIPYGIPGSIILLMGKLCLDWANSGTIGHLLSIADDLLLTGLPKSSTSVKSHQQAIRQMLTTRQQPLTPPGPLADEFRTTATHLLTTFAKFEGAQLAHMMRKSIEARDWLRCLEPRTIRSVIRRILEDLAAVDFQVSQLLPPSATDRGRGIKDGGRDSADGRYSWGSSMSYQRGHTAGMPLTAASRTLSASQQSHGIATSPEYDPTLASQLRRLFHRRVDVFAPVKPTRESILFGVIKIGLKAFSECARTRTFGKFGLQQIQVDCHYLYIHLWRFVSDEKQVQNVLDDVMYSVMQRCIESQLMEDSLEFEYGIKPRSLVCREYVERRLDLNRFDVDYSIGFDGSKRGPTSDIAMDAVESRYLLSANLDGSLLLYDTQSLTETNGGTSSVFPVLGHFTSVPSALLGPQHNPPAFHEGASDGRMSQTVCLQWSPVDTGCFFSVSVDNTLKVWDTNRTECVEVIATPELMTWAALSPCAREHNLVAVSLRQDYDRHTVCIDPLVGAPCLSLLGVHTAPLVAQILWSARNSFCLLTAGEDGRIVFWDIRVPLKAVATLSCDYKDGQPIYSRNALAHNGGVKGVANSPDGLHLLSWGGTGARNSSCLRVWGLDIAGGAPCASANAQPRIATAATASTTGPHSEMGSSRSVRLAVTSGGISPRLHVSGGEGGLVFVPNEQALLLASVCNPSYSRDSVAPPQWTVKRHFAKVTACVWNPSRLEAYTAGLDSNLYAWPLLQNLTDDEPQQ